MPTNSKDLIRAGSLPEARKQLIAEVKSSPSDARSRTLLFQVLSFYGEWEKAERHLDLIATQDSRAETGVQVYKNLVNAEQERKEVLGRKRLPGFITSAPSYLELYFAAWEKLMEKQIEEAGQLYAQIEAERPAITGAIAGKSFMGFKETDTFLSSFLEAIVHERYIWIPFESLRELSVSAPKTLFDLLWIPARVVTWEGLTVSCFLPVLYPDSFLHEDDRIKLGRMTDWTSLGGSFFKGLGQHVFQVGGEEIAMLELGDVAFNLPGQVKKG